MAAIALQKTISLNATNYFPSVAVRDGSDAEADVLENLHMNTTQAKTDQRPKEASWVTPTTALRHRKSWVEPTPRPSLPTVRLEFRH